MNDIKIGYKVAMVLTDTPLGVQIGKRHLLLYPQTLGKLYLTFSVIEKLEINLENIKANIVKEALRIVNNHREECCKLIAYHTLPKKSDMLNNRIVTARKNVISKNCDNDDLATLLITILSENKMQEIINHFGIDKESERMTKINQAKDNANQFVFGGKTVWGALIDAACERYGWTYDYVVWEISYNNLNLMLKDKITSIYLSDEERKKAHIPASNEKVLNGNNIQDVMEAVRKSEEKPV